MAAFPSMSLGKREPPLRVPSPRTRGGHSHGRVSDDDLALPVELPATSSIPARPIQPSREAVAVDFLALPVLAVTRLKPYYRSAWSPISKTAAFMGMPALRNLVSDSIAIDMGLAYPLSMRTRRSSTTSRRWSRSITSPES